MKVWTRAPRLGDFRKLVARIRVILLARNLIHLAPNISYNGRPHLFHEIFRAQAAPCCPGSESSLETCRAYNKGGQI